MLVPVLALPKVGGQVTDIRGDGQRWPGPLRRARVADGPDVDGKPPRGRRRAGLVAVAMLLVGVGCSVLGGGAWSSLRPHAGQQDVHLDGDDGRGRGRLLPATR